MNSILNEVNLCKYFFCIYSYKIWHFESRKKKNGFWKIMAFLWVLLQKNGLQFTSTWVYPFLLLLKWWMWIGFLQYKILSSIYINNPLGCGYYSNRIISFFMFLSVGIAFRLSFQFFFSLHFFYYFIWKRPRIL